MKLLGYRKDMPDPRDRPFDHIRPRLAMRAAVNTRFAVDNGYRIPLKRPPRDQVGNSCVANATARALEIASDIAGESISLRSAQGLYWCARQRVGETALDAGSYIRCAADALTKIGCAPAEDWPDDPDTVITQPGARYFVSSEDGRISAYHRISSFTTRLDDIELAVRANHAVVFGARVGQDFVDYNGDPDVVFDPPSVSVGGHAMVIVGVSGTGNDRTFTVLNSWGQWGQGGKGIAVVSADFALSMEDIWVFTRAPAP